MVCGNLHVLRGHGYPQILNLLKFRQFQATIQQSLTLQGSDIWLPEFGFFVWGFVEPNHGEMALEHFAAFLWVSCFKQKVKLNSFAAKIEEKKDRNEMKKIGTKISRLTIL